MMNVNGNQTKSPFRLNRKHQNLTPDTHQHKSPHVKNLINGSAHQIQLMGNPLMNALAVYGVEFAPGCCKGLGNSGVEVKMYEDAEGNKCGMLIKKDV